MGFVGGGYFSPPPQMPARQPHFRGCHKDSLLLVVSKGGEENIKMADNAAACTFVAATAICFCAPFEQRARRRALPPKRRLKLTCNFWLGFHNTSLFDEFQESNMFPVGARG